MSENITDNLVEILFCRPGDMGGQLGYKTLVIQH